MKYTNEIEIDLPRAKVVELFDNRDNMKYWQKGFVSLTPISGEPGATGAQSKLIYKGSKKNIEMIETISSRNLPEEFHGTYEMKSASLTHKNYFTEENGKTKWVSETDFRFSGLMKVMSFFMGTKPLKKQSQIYMDDFKSFAEGNPKHGT